MVELNILEFFKSRVEKLLKETRTTVETKEMLEDPLTTSRKQSEKILELENDIIRFKGDIERFGRKKDHEVARIKDLS